MNNGTFRLLTMGLALAALVAAESVTMIAIPLSGSTDMRLAAQDSNRDEEEASYLVGRRALNRGQFDYAATHFSALRERFPRGRYAVDSYYWEAFARYRQGDLPEALLILELMAVHDEAKQLMRDVDTKAVRSGRLYKEVRDLRFRIQRQQAEKGDPRAAEEVLRESEAVLLADTTKLGEAVTRERRARLSRVVADLRWRADSAMAVRVARLRADSLAQEYLLRKARADSAVAFGSLLADAEAQLRATDDALTRLWFRTADLAGFVQTDILENCHDASVQQEALTALLRLDGDRLGSVRNVLEREDECSAHLRHHAIEWLARQATEEAEHELMEVATNHSDNNTRKWAVMGLAEFQTTTAADVLSRILQESDDDGLRSEVITALRYNPHASATEALAAFSSDEEEPEELRGKAAAALGLRITSEPETLMGVFDRVDSEKIKVGFLGVLGQRAQRGEQAVTNWLFQHALNKEQSLEVRRAALEAWSRGPSVDLLRLAESYGQLEESELRERIFYALYRKARSDAETSTTVVDKMIELARGETDPEVRERAVYWLGRTGSERAAEFLIELLREKPKAPGGVGALPAEVLIPGLP